MPKYLPCGKNFLCTHTLEKYLAYIYILIYRLFKNSPQSIFHHSLVQKKKNRSILDKGKTNADRKIPRFL